jgi:hypothetical protein
MPPAIIPRMSVAKMSQQGRRSVVAIVWIAVGVLLIWRGLPYAGLRDDPEIFGLIGAERWMALGAGIVLGFGKGFSALRKGARRAATQIESKGEFAPAWTVFSPFMILLVGLMIAAGLALRHADYDATVKAWVVGILYPGIGVALIIGGLLARSVAPLPPKTSA